MNLEMSKRELQILVQSLANCIATCKTQHRKKVQPACEDCDAARLLQRKLEKQLAA
jgi:hypothetical protein